MKSARQLRKTVYVIPVALSAVSAPSAALAAWCKSVRSLPIYLLVRRTDLNGTTLSPQGIMSKLKDTYGHLDVHFSVLSEKHNRMLICVSSSKEITQSEKVHWYRGPGST